MRSAIIWAAAAAGAGLVVGAVALVLGSGHSSTPFESGMTTGIYLDRPEDAGPGSGLVYRRVAAAGAKLVRFTISWRDIAPASLPKHWDPTNPADPNYHWGTIDGEVESAVDHGLTPMITIYNAPYWAMDGGTPQYVPDSSYQPDPAKFAQFTTAATRRFDGSFHGLPRVRYWEAWNEPNITPYLEPQWVGGKFGGKDASPYWYRRMLNAFAGAVHATHGDLVIAGGLSPFTVDYPTVKSIGPLRFMRELLCMSAGPHPHPTCATTVDFDIWDHHPYTSGDAFHHAANPNDVSLGDLPKMDALLRAAAAAGHIASKGPVGFWVTEFSWDSNPPDPNGVPALLERRWTAEALYQMWRSGVTVAVWLLLRDDSYPGSPLQSGLYYRGATLAKDRPKPALAAFRFPFVAYLAHGKITYWGRLPQSSKGQVALEVRSGASGAWRLLTRVEADRDGIIYGEVAADATAADWVRASGPGEAGDSPAFSLTRPPDRPVHPFG